MKDHCNVLLLALSTFPYTLTMSENKFEWENEKEYTGIYQLDPVPKMLADQLAKNQEYLDKIIILATAPTITDEKNVEITYLDGTKKLYRGTPMDYFKSQIEGCLNPDSDPEERFVIVSIDEKNIEHGISDTIDIVRKIKNIRLYLDPHGGFRDISLVVEAVISLLRVEGIEVAGIYGIEFGQKGQKNRIVDGRSGFHIFDFVSGMNEFINYGRVNSLEKFLRQNVNNDSEGKEQQGELISSVRKVSEGIQLCNIPAFEDGLNELTKYKRINICNSYLSIFVDNIMSDYGVLLTESRTVVDEIEWCRKKGFYQQVLTLIESRVPKYLSSAGICSFYPGSGNDTDETNIFNRCVPWSYYNRGLSQGDRIHKILSKDSWYPRPNKQTDNEKDNTFEVSVVFHVPDAKAGLLDEFLKTHLELKNLRNISNHALDKKENKSLEDVDRRIVKYLAMLRFLVLTKYEAKIKKVTQKGNVMLSVLNGIEAIDGKQYVLKETGGELNWADIWKIKYAENPDQVYEVEFIKTDGPQYWFQLV